MPSLTAPAAKTATLTVVVKCRPLMDRERGRDIVRVNNDKEVVVLDPDLSKDYLDRIQNRTKEKAYNFDYAFPPLSSNADVYRKCIGSVIAGVVQGLNATVFAYGSTGSGKTYTMVGTQRDPGLMVLSLRTIFDLIKMDNSSDEFEVFCSYLEVYNEVIYDLLEKSSGHLELREDPEKGIIVMGLRSIKVLSADKILELLNLGNSRRKTESTEANATSSRSHAVLEITVRRKQRSKHRNQVLCGKLALVDLAGSERASETNSVGQKMRDGANINRSLLALANCINALGKQRKKGLVYVPYRNSKLTRILKDGLSGNSMTVMVATVSPTNNQYHHTVNTLKYADRAKEIKTHIQKNIGTIENHASEYQIMIESLQVEVSRLKDALAEKESQLSVKPSENASDEELSLLDILSRETSENVQERINLQKALFELEEVNLHNRIELQHLDDAIANYQTVEQEGQGVEALRVRRQIILDNVRDNDEAGVSYHKEIVENEKHRCELQGMIEEAINTNGNKTFLRILSQYRILGMANTELQFEMARRDQIIHNQRETHRNLWNLLMEFDLDENKLLELAARKGIVVGNGSLPSHLLASDEESKIYTHGKQTMAQNGTPVNHPCSHSYEQSQGSCTRSLTWDHTICREEHHHSYFRTSHSNVQCMPSCTTANLFVHQRPTWFQSSESGQDAGTNSSQMKFCCPHLPTIASPVTTFSADYSLQIKEACRRSTSQPSNGGHFVEVGSNQNFREGSMMVHIGNPPKCSQCPCPRSSGSSSFQHRESSRRINKLR